MLAVRKFVCSFGEFTSTGVHSSGKNIFGRRNHIVQTFRKANNCNMTAVKWPQVFLFGDSLTQQSFTSHGCWGSLLADELQRKCDVLNRGFGGYNTKWCEMILPRLLSKNQAERIVTMVIFLGANDSTIEGADQHVPVEEYKDNLVKMVDYAKSVGVSADKIILMGPPPCCDEKWPISCVERGYANTKDNSVVGAYSNACEAAAKQCGVGFVDLYFTMMKQQNWQRFLGDGLHFSRQGSEFLFQTLWPHVQCRTAHLCMIMPHWSEVDHNNPAASFSNV